MKNKQKSDEWFNEASKYLNTYYGQLAFVETNPGESFLLYKNKIKCLKNLKKNLIKILLIKSVRLLNELDKAKYSKDFLKHLAIFKYRKGSEILAGKLSY